MAFDLSLVTRSLVRLLDGYISEASGWPASAPYTVLPEVPESPVEAPVLSVCLYLVSDDEAIRNAPARGSFGGGSAESKSLKLHYRLSAHGTHGVASGDEPGAYAAQRLLGLALQAFRDHPYITRRTSIGGTEVMPAGSEPAVRLQIVPLPVAADEIRNASIATGSVPPLAAYFEVLAVTAD